MDPNPYKPPIVTDVMPGPPRPDVGVTGKFLVVRSGAELPQRCVHTNQKVTELDMQHKWFEWCSPWVALSVLISVCITVVLYFVLRKRCELTFGLSPEIRRKYRTRIAIKLLITIGLFFAIVAAAAAENDALIGLSVLLFFVAIIVLLVGNSPLRVTSYRDGEFYIKGCSAEFLAQLSGGSPFAEKWTEQKGF